VKEQRPFVDDEDLIRKMPAAISWTFVPDIEFVTLMSIPPP
jgi:hypothetical protein